MADVRLIRDLINDRQAELTASERRLTAVLMDESLVPGLKSVTKLAEQAGVSTPTVIRLARKLGFDGFRDLQEAIREEVAARMKQPLAKLTAGPVAGHESHLVSRFAKATAENINRTLDRLDIATFDAVANELSDPKRNIHLLGGRITRSNAHYFFNHLQIIRPGVSLLDSSPSAWPQALLEMGPDSTLVIFDIRRYEKELDRLTELAVAQGVRIVLFTDQWGSPIERHAHACFRAMVEAPSSWDSTLAISFLIETLVAGVQHRSPESSAKRISQMEEMIGVTRIFRGM